MIPESIYRKFCKWSPSHAKMIMKWRPWGSTSIAIWLTNGQKYKVKFCGGNSFIMQMLTDEDIEKKGKEVKQHESN